MNIAFLIEPIINQQESIPMISLTTSIDTIIHLFDTSTVLYVEDENHQILGQIKASSFMHALIQDNHQKGVMDTFAEMVKAGMKKIALAHPFKIKEERDSYIDYVEEICQNYGIHYYLDNDPLITDLFEKHLNYKTYNIIFYRSEEDINEYNELKTYKYSRDYDEIRYEVAYRFGKLLSYSDETINRYIDNNHEKE